MQEIYLFDWGNTLMMDIPGITGKMCDWEHVEAMAYAEEALETISSRASIYIATAAADSTPGDIEKAFQRVGLHRYIKGYFCRQNTGFTKPAPAFYLAITQALCIEPGSVTMVGDSLENDIFPCHRLGFKTIWLRGRQNMKPPKGVRIIEDLSELSASPNRQD